MENATPRLTQKKLKLAKPPISWLDLGRWTPGPGHPHVRADHFLEFCARVKQAGLHLMRTEVVTKPCQGYRCVVVSGNYSANKTTI